MTTHTVELDPKRWGYSPRELKGLGLGGSTWAYGEINSGKLPAKKLGSRTIILVKDLRDYLENLPDYEVDTAAPPNDMEPDPETIGSEPADRKLEAKRCGPGIGDRTNAREATGG